MEKKLNKIFDEYAEGNMSIPDLKKKILDMVNEAMAESNKLHNDYYSKYVGKYAKRFYTPYKNDTIFPIVGFILIYNEELGEEIAHFIMEDKSKIRWNWDVEDCTIVIDELPIEDDDERVVSIHDKEYKGFNPYNK